MSEGLFSVCDDRKELEEGDVCAPRFDANGLITCVVQDAKSGLVLMVAYMNQEALALTIQTRRAHYWSRSRGKLWIKGESSGLTQAVVELRTDCDQDCLLMKVEVGSTQSGATASCHVGYPGCFYRQIALGSDAKQGPVKLKTVEERVFDPKEVYGS